MQEYYIDIGGLIASSDKFLYLKNFFEAFLLWKQYISMADTTTKDAF